MRGSLLFLVVVLVVLTFVILYWVLRPQTRRDQIPMVLHAAYPRPTFERIRQYLEGTVDIRAEPKEDNELADRSSVKINPREHAFLYKLLESNSFGLPKARVSRRVPVEYRIYKEGSFGMRWHHDARVLPKTMKYYEVTLTLSNTSDCRFEYVLSPTTSLDKLPGVHVSFNTSKDREIRAVQTPANTAVFVHPESVLHRATGVKRGERVFLKFVLEYGD